MLPLSHTYVSTKVTGKKTPLLILGSVLPDIATTSSQQIVRQQIHDSPTQFNTFVTSNYPQLLDLSLGVSLHSPINGGADFYSDDTKTGYAKIEGKKISQQVADLLEVQDGDISFILAHNFIEMAVDLHIYNNHREIWEIYNEGMENVQNDLMVVSNCLADYLNMEEAVILTEINNLMDMLGAKNLTSVNNMIDFVAIPLIKVRLNKDISTPKAIEIAEQALRITEGSYKEFLDNAVIGVKKNISPN